MIRAVIVDDEAPARAKLRHGLSLQADVEIAGEFADGLSAAQCIGAHPTDVVFLDIQMPGLSGLDLAAQLETSQAPLLVFVTAYDAHALAAFDLNAVDYLLKPYDEERLRRTVDRVRERLQAPDARSSAIRVARTRAGSERLLVPVGGELRLIESASIQRLAADDNYVQVWTATQSYLLRRTLRDLLLQLGDERFVRIHKSAAVNIAEIELLAPLFKGDYELKLRSGTRLRLSRRYAAALFAKIGR